MIQMTQGIAENSTLAQKDSLLKKAARPLVRRLRTMVKMIKKKFLPYNGNYYYGQTAEDYERVRTKQDWWHIENQVVSELLEDIPRGSSILDVPFGTGRFLPLYAQRQMKVTGLDISYAMLATAQRLREDLVRQCKLDVGDARSLPYGDGSFDVVLSFRFLDGIITFKDQKKVLSELVRVSRKYLILEVFSVPNGEDMKLMMESLKDSEPVNGRLSELERKKLLESFGIRILKRIPAALEAGRRSIGYLCEKEARS
jgi:ubiquinone/menaquinone biosynthesis C-methylase UbiE